MPKYNPYLENKKPIELVQELKDEIKKSPLSPAARGKVINKSGSNYVSESKGDYGPCRNSICGCSCSADKCICEGASIEERYFGTRAAATGRKRDGNASGQVSYHALGFGDSDGEARFFGGSAGGEVGKSGFKVQASADIAKFKSKGVEGRVGPSVDTGIKTDDGLEVKAVGFGFSVNDEQVGISTPIGEIKVDNDKCLIQ